MKYSGFVALMLLTAAATPLRYAGAQEIGSYHAYVAAESEDEVALVSFTPGAGLVVEKTISVGSWPAEIEGPHGVAVEPDGRHWLVTLGHGFPYGSMLRYTTDTDSLVGRIDLGLFPATVTVSPLGGFAFVVNANFHGDHLPSTVSVVDVATMTEVDQLDTCIMPHGSRLSSDGKFQYHTCMMDDMLVEIDVLKMRVSRTLPVGVAGVHGDHQSDASAPCSPTWAAPHPDGRRLYVMCNKSHEIVEVDLESWQVARSWSAPGAPYNAVVSPDGARLLVTQKASAELSVWDLATGTLVGAVTSGQRVTHGVAVTPDGKYAFVTMEGVGGEPGRVEVVDLATLATVAAVEVGKQAGGVTIRPSK